MDVLSWVLLEEHYLCFLRKLSITFLQKASTALQRLGQNSSLEQAIKPLSISFAKHGLLHDKDKYIKHLVTICCCEIIRIMAPEQPFGDDELQVKAHSIHKWIRKILWLVSNSSSSLIINTIHAFSLLFGFWYRKFLNFLLACLRSYLILKAHISNSGWKFLRLLLNTNFAW